MTVQFKAIKIWVDELHANDLNKIVFAVVGNKVDIAMRRK
jgi:hypothetical protein